MTDFADIWSYLAQGPLLWLTATLIAYLFGAWLQKLSGTKPWVNPVLIAVALLAGVLVLTGTAYETYFEGAQFVRTLVCVGAGLGHVEAERDRVALRRIGETAMGVGPDRARENRWNGKSGTGCGTGLHHATASEIRFGH